MKKNKSTIKDFLYPFAMLIGTIIGVGIFGLPYVASQAGLLVMLAFFVVMGLVIYFVNSMYGSIILSNTPKMRLPAQIGAYLGPAGKHFMFIIAILALSGTMLAYLVVGGAFTHELFGHFFGGGYLIYVLIYFAAGAWLVFRDQSSVAQAETWMMLLFVVVILIIGLAGFGKYELAPWREVNLAHFFLPYGITIFSFWGTSIMPEVSEMCGNNRRLFQRVLTSALLFSGLFYLIFILIVLGLSGRQTTPDALTGLAQILSPRIMLLAYFFGFLTCFTSFITMGLTLKKIFWFDYRVNKHLAWFLACFIPLVLFLLGLKDFLNIISLIGGIALGIIGIMIFWSYLRLKQKIVQRSQLMIKVPKTVVYILMAIFIIGVILEIYFGLI